MHESVICVSRGKVWTKKNLSDLSQYIFEYLTGTVLDTGDTTPNKAQNACLLKAVVKTYFQKGVFQGLGI